MPMPASSSHDDYWTHLLRKYKARSLSLAECYELKRWLEEGFVNHPRTPTEERALADIILAGVLAVIADKESIRL